MKIKLTTISALLCSTGESSAHIDADIRFDQYGLPYIPGKTIKGLLRESAREVCELSGYSDECTEKIMDNLFGQSGSKQTDGLIFNNLLLLNYTEICNDIRNCSVKLHYRDVQNYFTLYRRQTRINENGTAADKSLRTYRLLKMGFQFEGVIENLQQFSGKVEYKVFILALLQLRNMGLRRNRGFGKVRILHESLPVKSVPSSFDFNSIDEKDGDFKLSFKISNHSPLQFSKPIGDQNTVGTEDFIPAQNIRGLIASVLANYLKGDLHKDPIFQKLFLNGATKYNGAFPIVNGNKTSLTPLALGYNKLTKVEDRLVTNMMLDSNAASKSWKNWFFLTQENEVEFYNRFSTETVFSFHASRNTSDERKAGRSIEATGGIYYYEAIEKDQHFQTDIYGSYQNLSIIQLLLEQNLGLHRMGHSKSAQYGQVQISDFNIEEFNNTTKAVEIKKDYEFYLVFQSPVILYNQFGMAIADGNLLESELKKMNIKLLDIRSNVCWIENYMQVWNCKTPREQAYDMGTTLKVAALEDVMIPKNESFYIGERLSEGYGTLKFYRDLPNNLKVKRARIQSSGLSPNYDVKSELIRDLIAVRKTQHSHEKIKLKAFEEALKIGEDKISNHLIARLRFKLDSCGNDFIRWQRFIDHIDGKPAGKALRKVIGNLNSIRDLEFSNSENLDERIMYWKSWLNMLRIKSKHSKKGISHVQSNS